jgi:hypothetical protein
VQAVLVGRGGWLEHFGLGGGRKFRDAVPWEAVVRVEGARIIVRDGTELE